MSLTFDSNGVQISTFDEIFQALVDGYKEIYGTDIIVDQESPDGQRIGIESTLRYDTESAIAWLYSQIDPDLNTGDMQQVIAKFSGIYLLASSRSQWDLTVNVSRDITLPSGYTVADQNGVEWFLDSDVDLTTGDNAITFLAVEWGGVVGVSSGSSFTQSTPELYVNSISASADATTGREEETEEEFRVRRKNSTENPSFSTAGAMYAKLAQIQGVSDLYVHENYTNTDDAVRDIEAHTLWAVIEGGSLDDIGEVIVKQRLGNTKGSVLVDYADVLTRPDGTTLTLQNPHYIDRPDYIPLYVRLTTSLTTIGESIDTDAIKEKIASFSFRIFQYVQAGELYAKAYIDNYNYVVSDLEISLDGLTWTDERLFSGYGGKFTLDTDDIAITVA